MIDVFDSIETRLKSLEWGYKSFAKGFLISCPNKEWHKSGDKHFSCIVWPEINWFRCMGCGSEGRLPRLFEGTDEELPALWSFPASTIRSREQPENPELDESILSHLRLATPDDLDCPGFRKRGWDESHITTFDLRVHDEFDSIVFPVRSPSLVGAVGRGRQKKILHNYFGFFTGLALGGLDKLTKANQKILVVEGWTCLVHCHRWAEELGYDVVCTFTANVSERQAILLSDTCKRIVFGFDQDKAGQKGIAKAHEIIADTVIAKRWNSQLGDVGSMSRETFVTIFGD